MIPQTNPKIRVGAHPISSEIEFRFDLRKPRHVSEADELFVTIIWNLAKRYDVKIIKSGGGLGYTGNPRDVEEFEDDLMELVGMGEE